MPLRRQGLRLGRPHDLFFDDLDAVTRSTVESALLALSAAGVEIVEFDLPEVHERSRLFTSIVPAELLARLTPEVFAKARPDMDPVTAMRAAQGLEVSAIEYAACQFRRLELEAIAAATFEGMDAWRSEEHTSELQSLMRISYAGFCLYKYSDKKPLPGIT